MNVNTEQLSEAEFLLADIEALSEEVQEEIRAENRKIDEEFRRKDPSAPPAPASK